MVDHSFDKQLSEIPENILLAIASMDNPTVEAIRRKLPGPKKQYAEELWQRFQGSAVPEEAATTSEAAAEWAVEDTASAGGETGGLDEWASITAAMPMDAGASAATTEASEGGSVKVPSESTVPSMMAENPHLSDDATADAGQDDSADEEEEQPKKRRLSDLAKQAKELREKGRRARVDENDFVDLYAEDFAEFAYDEESLKPQGRVKARIFQEEEASTVEITWSPGTLPTNDEIFTVFRVVASDRVVECSPDLGQQIIVTEGKEYVEQANPGVAVRHYQVWAYTGEDLNDILDSQPYFIGEDLVVFPVEGVEVQCSDGIVEGNWNFVEQYDQVQVFASPEKSGDRVDSPEFRLPAGVSNHSFKHETNSTGQTMRYAFKPFVKFRQSEVAGKVVVKTVEVKAVLQAPEIDAFLDDSSGRGDKVILSWYSPPAGNVRIYFTPKAPSTDLTITTVPESALDYDPAIAEGHKAIEDPWTQDGISRTETASWPSGWTELHITPITVLNDEAVVGKSVVLQQVGEVAEATIVERTSQQIINFVWPQGADIVRVEVAPRGTGGDSYRETRAELDRGRYIRDGGVRLNLNPDGETVFLTPLSTFAGRETASTPLQLDYPGLAKYFYSMEFIQGIGFKVFIWKEDGEDLNPPSFVGVYHPARLPLAETDANDMGAAKLQISTVRNLDGQLVSEPGAILSPERLPGSEAEARAAENCFFVGFRDQEFDSTTGGRLRLFIQDEAQDEHMPRRILLDTFNQFVAG